MAELGVLGSIPWIGGCVIFIITLFARTTGDHDRFSLGVLRATLAGFGMIFFIMWTGIFL